MGHEKEWAVVRGSIDPYEGQLDPDRVITGFKNPKAAEMFCAAREDRFEWWAVVEVERIDE